MGSNRAGAARLACVLGALVCTLGFAAGPASAAKPLPRPAPVAHDALTRALARGQLTPAAYALERARSLFRLGAVRREFGQVARPDPHAATLILRDLALRVDQLPRAERAQAERLLARPSDGADDPDKWGWFVPEAPASPICDANVCYHWVDSSEDAPPAADQDTNDVPDWVEDVTQPTFANVWQKEIVELGNPAPLSDNTSPNDGGQNEGDPNRHKLDVYLVNVGAVGLFGFCSSDDPRLDSNYKYFDISSYCVVDNDFVNFGNEWTPQQFLEATAAHEFRHASQFALDAFEDYWLMEGEAMWMEGVVYPDVKDRIRYLNRSPIRRSGRGLDHGAGGYEYGAWIFFRFLGEYFDDVAVMREIWARADGSGDSDGPLGPDGIGPDEYSMQATATAIAGRGDAFTPVFATFAEWNRSPSRYYEEGALYPSPFTGAEWRLGPGATTDWRSTRLRHLASAYYSFRPRSTVRPAARLRVAVDGPALTTKPAAKLIVVTTSGYLVHTLSLNASGNAARTVSFAPGTVKRVDLVLINASRRYNLSTCWTGRTNYSCGGAIALDELRTYRFKATVG